MYKEAVPMENGNNKLSTWVKVKFGVADFGLSMLTSLLAFYMVFYYTDVVKINPAIAGTAILVGKLTWDMINDVLCGYISDRTKSRWGRRRPVNLW
jgi:GPH family glycoside/pentoside/hexuronide:cation symporter